MPEAPSILCCLCAHADVLPEEVAGRVLRWLRGAGVAFEAVPDLCGLAARRDPALKRIAASGAVKIAACYPRAVKWLFAAGGAPLPEQGVEILNMRAQPAEDIIRSLLGPAPAEERRPGPEDEPRPAGAGEWMPWFPVIDYDRCQGCRQCLGFCLFGVYALDEDGRVRVASPTRCKTNCPACARVCPETAIIFPKYPGSPINGDEVRPEDVDRQKMQVDLPELLAGDVYQTLRGRGKGPGPQPQEELDRLRALKERDACSCSSQPEGNVVSLEALLSAAARKQVRDAAEQAEGRPAPQDAPARSAGPDGKDGDGGG